MVPRLLNGLDEKGEAHPNPSVVRSKTRHYGMMVEQAPALVAALTEWRDCALSFGRRPNR